MLKRKHYKRINDVLDPVHKILEKPFMPVMEKVDDLEIPEAAKFALLTPVLANPFGVAYVTLGLINNWALDNRMRMALEKIPSIARK